MDDPDERKQFWLRIAAEVGKEGDGISNFITGALKATMDSKAAREKKNQLFRNIQKEGMRIRNEIDKQELTLRS